MFVVCLFPSFFLSFVVYVDSRRALVRAKSGQGRSPLARESSREPALEILRLLAQPQFQARHAHPRPSSAPRRPAASSSHARSRCHWTPTSPVAALARPRTITNTTTARHVHFRWSQCTPQPSPHALKTVSPLRPGARVAPQTRDGLLMPVPSGPPLVRPRLRCLLRRLPPAVPQRRRQGKGRAKRLGAQGAVYQRGQAAVGQGPPVTTAQGLVGRYVDDASVSSSVQFLTTWCSQGRPQRPQCRPQRSAGHNRQRLEWATAADGHDSSLMIDNACNAAIEKARSTTAGASAAQ